MDALVYLQPKIAKSYNLTFAFHTPNGISPLYFEIAFEVSDGAKSDGSAVDSDTEQDKAEDELEDKDLKIQLASAGKVYEKIIKGVDENITMKLKTSEEELKYNHNNSLTISVYYERDKLSPSGHQCGLMDGYDDERIKVVSNNGIEILDTSLGNVTYDNIGNHQITATINIKLFGDVKELIIPFYVKCKVNNNTTLMWYFNIEISTRNKRRKR